MTGSKDRRDCYALLIVFEVTGARVAVIADRQVVGRTCRTAPGEPAGELWARLRTLA
jgi:hypothetical protein